MTMSQNKKIMDFDVSLGYEAFVSIFNDEEIAEMDYYLRKEYDYDYSYLPEKEMKECIIIDYVKEWLIENIRDISYNGTEQLFNIIYNL